MSQQVTIYVNTRAKTVDKEELSYDDLLKLAFGDAIPKGENILITVVYYRKKGEKEEGKLLPGKTVKVKDGMIFDVTATDKS